MAQNKPHNPGNILFTNDTITPSLSAKEVFSHRKAIRDILAGNPTKYTQVSDEKEQINYSLLISDYLESIGQTPWISLEMYNLFVTLARSYTDKKVNYNQIMKRFRKKDLSATHESIASKKSKPESLTHLVKNQSSDIEQGIVELISNGVDAMNPTKSIGRFGEGFYQSLRFLRNVSDEIRVSTKKQDELPYIAKIRTGQKFGYELASSTSNRTEAGTSIKIVHPLTTQEQQNIIHYVTRAFATNKNAGVYINGTKANILDGYVYHNGHSLEQGTSIIAVNIDSDGVSVEDTGVGMSSLDLSEKLLAPKTSGKKKMTFPSKDELHKAVQNDTAMFYKKTAEGTKNTNIRLSVAGVLIEDFSIDSVQGIADFTFDFPSFTWIPDSRNRIELTPEVIVSLGVMMDKISQIGDTQELGSVLSILGAIITKFESRGGGSDNDPEYDLKKTLSSHFSTLRNTLEKTGKKCVHGSTELQQILGNRDDIVYIHPTLCPLDFRDIPGVRTLSNIEKQTRPFYTCHFADTAPVDYLITPRGILVNEAYLSDPDKIDILNVCINLNFGYETESERVQYGVIPYMSENTDKNPSALESPETVNIYKNSLEEREKFAKEMESYFYTQYDQLLASGTPYQNRLSQLLLPDSHWYKTHDIETWSVEKAFFHVFFPSYLSSSSEVLTEENTQIYNGFSSMIETLTLDEVKKLESCVNTLGTSPERDIMLLRFLDMYGKVGSKQGKLILGLLHNLAGDFNRYLGVTHFEILNKVTNGGKLSHEEWMVLRDNTPILLFKSIICQLTGATDVDTIVSTPEGFVYLIQVGGKKVPVFLNEDNMLEMITHTSTGEEVGRCRGLVSALDGFACYIMFRGGWYPAFLNKEGKLERMVHTSIGEEIVGCSDLISTPDGFMCSVQVNRNKYPAFLNKEKKLELITHTSTGEEITDCKNLISTPDGFMCIVEKAEWGKYPAFLNEDKKLEVITHTSTDEAIERCSSFTSTPDGFVCEVRVGGSLYLAFLNKDRKIELITLLSTGEKFGYCHSFTSTPNGFVCCVVVGPNGYPAFLNKEKKLEFITHTSTGEQIEYVESFVATPQGFACFAKVGGVGGVYYPAFLNKDRQLELMKSHVMSHDTRAGEVLESTQYGFSYMVYAKFYEGNSKISGNKILNGEHYRGCLYAIPQDIITAPTTPDVSLVGFNALLRDGGEFLSLGESQISEQKYSGTMEIGTLSELMLLYRANQELFTDNKKHTKKSTVITRIFQSIKDRIQNISKIEMDIPSTFRGDIFSQFDRTTRTADHLRPSIFSTMESQDRSGMIWLREAVQNARDAMIATGKLGGAINMDFFQDDKEQFIARVSDPVGMTPHQVWNYLLPPGSSSKVSKDGGGMFGQGFYSLMIGARELTVKTSAGDGKVTYIKYTPKRNKEGNVDDFDLKVSTIEEWGNFKGTIIERVDEASGIMGNIQALVGTQFTDLYVGNIEGVDVMYNGVKRNQGVVTHGTWDIPGLGTLSLKQNPDRKERLTSKGLYVSEIHKSYLEMLPDWMVSIVHAHGLSLDIPQAIELTKSRNAVANSADISSLQPYIFALVSEYIVDGFYKGRNTIEMLPLDYLGLSQYDTIHSSVIKKIAKKHNAGKLLNLEEMESLKSPECIIEFLVLIDAIEIDGKKISLRELKKRNKKGVIDTSGAGSVFQGRIHQAKAQGNRLDVNMELGYRKVLSLQEKIHMSPEEILLLKKRKALMGYLDTSFATVVKTYFGEDVRFKNGIYQRKDKQESAAADYGISINGIYMNWNIDFIDRWLDFESNPSHRKDIIQGITHELTHLREGDKWGSHETGNHSRAFEYMQREILGTYLRSSVK